MTQFVQRKPAYPFVIFVSRRWGWCVWLVCLVCSLNVSAGGFAKQKTAVTQSTVETQFTVEQTGDVEPGDVEQRDAIRRGWEVLTELPLLPGDFSQEVIDDIWRSWPPEARAKAAQASLEERQRLIYQRYGLSPRPTLRVESSETGDLVARFDLDESVLRKGNQPNYPGPPMQYVVDEDGQWTMNCLSCHGGSVYGVPTPGAPNNRYALQTLTEEVRSTKFRMGKPLGRMELGSMVIPLGTTNGTTNAVVFGMGLMHYRDANLNVVQRTPVSFTHHDMDAPPWWHFHKRPYLYIDGFAQKGHRGLMQFTLVPENGPDFYRDNEDHFRDVFAFLSALRPPKYEGPIDEDLAETGRHLFNDNCSRCHGTYGAGGDYPNQMVPIDEIGTDPVRFEALTVAGRQTYADSWFARDAKGVRQETLVDPEGYVAPPLDGVWASPPYFHNGSVPTLWHVLHPEDRPQLWRRVDESMDEERVGFKIELAEKVPLTQPDVQVRRSYFDTSRVGKSAKGHDYPNELTEPEKQAVLEYLKTL
ncbi:c-type cytochrome [Rhodopirellula halodulae]|uniref:c-type cytochrome n=1 Tax=Rhodopirellula halodulae TaxID=2894198 RepID=UPI001E290746|nr:c-type cytochrome [Rhodopirellula sp. JC737]MCC9658482.1 c-type cytochrome [Rhodopirellula sp. JC737]